MSWIKTIPPSEADAELTALYEKVVDPRSGQLDNIMTVHSLSPRGLSAHFDLYCTVMRGSRSLRKVDREMIALTVSQLNACHY